jgi:UDP-2,4-diacetamido-2,4,6-trideoxy-beta-L-altropyranose hydrolase
MPIKEIQAVIIRCDSGVIIGTGHVMRCLTLAEELRKREIGVMFAIRDLPGYLGPLIEERGFKVHVLQGGYVSGPTKSAGKDHMMHGDFLEVDQLSDVRSLEQISELIQCGVVVVDHYGIDEDWERELVKLGKKIVVIDDLADRKHICHALIDQNYYDDMATRYAEKVPQSAMKLIGPEYAMVRDFFAKTAIDYDRKNWSEGQSQKNIVISFGGRDPHGYGLKVAQAAVKCRWGAHFQIYVLGDLSEADGKQLKKLGETGQVHFVGYTKEPWNYLASAHLYIGAGGTTTWERCAAALPAMVYAISKNQIRMSEQFARQGYQHYLGLIEKFSEAELITALDSFFSDFKSAEQMSQRSRALVDGAGCRRVADIICGLFCDA